VGRHENCKIAGVTLMVPSGVRSNIIEVSFSKVLSRLARFMGIHFYPPVYVMSPSLPKTTRRHAFSRHKSRAKKSSLISDMCRGKHVCLGFGEEQHSSPI